uniref:PH domain-containing protein n=1 Tax=Globisporangium ultimum (strain ATCC 200006 / CBS 805.95 / DAOM BR144) TaxID=431595 RepID=K3X5R6_GLOUD
MRRIYHARNQEFLRLKEHTETQAKLQAEWAGYLWKQGERVFNTWQERYCAIRSGRLEYWQSIADAKSGI